MAIIRTKIEEHIHNNKQDNELASRIHKKRRIEDNLFLLHYCIKKSFKMRKPLITIAIDFKKAFDSIKRKSLVECMKKFRIHPHIIDVISEMDQKDRTILYLNTEIVTNIQVSSSIRQGCTGSTSLLLLLTHLIILHLNPTVASKMKSATHHPCCMQMMAYYWLKVRKRPQT